jgi:hypothetical protein
MSIGDGFPMLMKAGLILIFLNLFITFGNEGEWCAMTTITNVSTCIYSVIGTMITTYSAKEAIISYRF